MPNTHKNLTELFTACANALRSKLGTSGLIVADEIPTKIAQITPKLKDLTLTLFEGQGTTTYMADGGYEGFRYVFLPGIHTTEGTATTNGVLNAPSGQYFKKVTVAIPTYNGEVT